MSHCLDAELRFHSCRTKTAADRTPHETPNARIARLRFRTLFREWSIHLDFEFNFNNKPVWPRGKALHLYFNIIKSCKDHSFESGNRQFLLLLVDICHKTFFASSRMCGSSLEVGCAYRRGDILREDMHVQNIVCR
jgi:hypothetical protein